MHSPACRLASPVATGRPQRCSSALPCSQRPAARPVGCAARSVGPEPAWQQQQRRQQQRQREQRSVQVFAMAGDSDKKTKVLFVCLGNICRSPSAEAVFKNVVERAGVAGQFEIDSCGTGGGSSNWYRPGGFSYHEGDPADSRMTATARTRGITLTSRSRPLTPEDLAEFDYILGMDASNMAAIQRAADYWRSAGGASVPEGYTAKLSLMTDHLQSPQFKGFNEVPDPYYGGQKGFDLVLDLLDDACTGLLATIQQQQQQRGGQ